MKMKPAAKLYTALVFLFLFAPLVILLVFSFNSNNSTVVFEQVSTHWYKELFRDAETLRSLENTLILAVCASLISTVMGTAAAVGINKLRNKYMKAALDTATNIPMMNPDIITGISLMLMFVFVGQLFGLSTSLSFWTMLIAHITFCLPYVILQVLPKLQQMDPSLPEAAMDLGCTPLRAFFRVELPEILPGVITGMLMAFTLSLDDFVISFFTQDTGFQTLPIHIYNMTKKKVTPKMYALATLIFFAILALLLLTNLVDEDDSRRIREARAAKRSNKQAKKQAKKSRRPQDPNARGMKIAAGIMGAVILIIAGIAIAGSHPPPRELNIYNWGEYISDGAEGTLDTIAAFEDWYEETYGERVKVNYDTFDSNENMYAKLSSGAVSYDVIIPSDYMIERMIQEDMLLPLNFDNIPNYEYIDESFRGLFYDPNDTYSIPYTYGVVGIIYDANRVDKADVGSWDLMWNEKYAGSILQFNNPRDAFGTAMYRANADVNTEDHAVWDAAYKSLNNQSKLVKSYVMDEIYNMMESGEAAIGAYYAGDYYIMLDAASDDVDLQFFYPEPTNFFVDAMCIPKCCLDKELAEIFINYMLSEEPAVANAEYIYYASPNRLVYENEDYIEEMGEEAMETLYRYTDNFSEYFNRYAYHNLSQEAIRYMNELWEELKIS